MNQPATQPEKKTGHTPGRVHVVILEQSMAPNNWGYVQSAASFLYDSGGCGRRLVVRGSDNALAVIREAEQRCRADEAELPAELTADNPAEFARLYAAANPRLALAKAEGRG